MLLSIMTYNIGGGSRALQDGLEDRASRIRDVIAEVSPDILIIQEAARWIRNGGRGIDLMQPVCSSGEFPYVAFRKTISLKHDYSPRNSIMARALAGGYQDWEKGNAILSKLPLSWSDTTSTSSVVSFPVFDPPRYLGTRDSEQRAVICSRVDLGKLHLGIFGVHLSTLTGERGTGMDTRREVEAQMLRAQQVRSMLVVVSDYRTRYSSDPIVVLGDFNEPNLDAPAMQALRAASFRHLGPSPSIPTHLEQQLVVDHVFGDGILADHLVSIDVFSKLDEPSDHRPVVAKFDF